jgi:hypothetical protein
MQRVRSTRIDSSQFTYGELCSLADIVNLDNEGYSPIEPKDVKKLIYYYDYDIVHIYHLEGMTPLSLKQMQNLANRLSHGQLYSA